MISPQKFAQLGNNQKIYKIASSLRALENALKNNQPADISQHLAYCAYLQGEDRKIKEALQIIKPLLSLPDAPKERLKTLNFAYHSLLALLDKKEDQDSKFSFIRFDGAVQPRRFPWVVILDNLRSPMNVGSIFRSGDGFGVGGISLCGICPAPPDPKITRTALGAEDTVPWQYFDTTDRAIAHWKEKNYKIYALEVAEPSIALGAVQSFDACAFIIGNEEFGITEQTLALADAVVRIPLNGVKNSLNAANCFAVLAYEAQRYFKGGSHV